VELHALAQRELERLAVHPAPFGGQGGDDPEALGVAVHQPVEGRVADDDAGPLAVVVGIDVRHRVAEADAQRVRAALRRRMIMPVSLSPVPRA
jgi:hypothetical protein